MSCDSNLSKKKLNVILLIISENTLTFICHLRKIKIHYINIIKSFSIIST